MADALPCDIGNVEQTVNAAKINKCTVVGDVFHHTLQHLTFLQI